MDLPIEDKNFQERLRCEMSRALSERNHIQGPLAAVALYESQDEPYAIVTYRPDQEEFTSQLRSKIESLTNPQTTLIFSMTPLLTNETAFLLKGSNPIYYCGRHPLLYVQKGRFFNGSEHKGKMPHQDGVAFRQIPWVENPFSFWGFLKSRYWGYGHESPSEEMAFMEEAVHMSEISRAQTKPLVGAVLVKEGRIIGKGTQMYSSSKKFFHAERAAIMDALANLGEKDALEEIVLLDNLREMDCLHDTTLYVTLEPCMKSLASVTSCSDLIIHSGIPRVRFGIQDNFYHGRAITYLRSNNVQVAPAIFGSDLERRLFNHKGNFRTGRVSEEAYERKKEEAKKNGSKETRPWKRHQKARNRHRHI